MRVVREEVEKRMEDGGWVRKRMRKKRRMWRMSSHERAHREIHP